MYILVKLDVLCTCLSEHKRDLKPINIAKLKEDEVNTITALVKHCLKYKHGINFVKF